VAILGKLSKPAIAWWQYLDKVTLGLATYIAAALALVILYFFVTFLWMILKMVFLLITPIFMKLLPTAITTSTSASAADGGGAAAAGGGGILTQLAKKGITGFALSQAYTLIETTYAFIIGLVGLQVASQTVEQTIAPTKGTSSSNNKDNKNNNNKKSGQHHHDEDF
jgi:hypothetical protein